MDKCCQFGTTNGTVRSQLCNTTCDVPLNPSHMHWHTLNIHRLVTTTNLCGRRWDEGCQGAVWDAGAIFDGELHDCGTGRGQHVRLNRRHHVGSCGFHTHDVHNVLLALAVGILWGDFDAEVSTAVCAVKASVPRFEVSVGRARWQ